MAEDRYWSSRRMDRRGLIGSGLASGSALALAACGGSSKNNGAVNSAAKSGAAGGTSAAGGAAGKPVPSQATGTAVGQAKQGGTASVRILADPPNFSVLTASTYTAAFANLAYNKLVALKVDPSVPANEVVLVPDLAIAMPEQPDPQTYTFKLRPGVKWQNVAPVSGRLLTADEVKQAIDVYRSDNNSAFRADYEPIESVTVIDSATVQVKTKEPYAPMLALSAGHYGWRIFPADLLQNDDIKTKAVGTGPWILDSYQQSSKATYHRNPDYFKQGLPHLDALTLVVIPQDPTAISAFETGQINVISQVNCVNADEIKRQKPNAHSGQTFDTYPGGYIAMNTTKPPFSDVRVRRAISLGFNRKAEIDALECGTGLPDQLVPRGAWKPALAPEDLGDAAQYWKYDTAKAKALLAEAGVAPGTEIQGVWTPQYGQSYQSSIERAVADFAAIGLKLTPVSVQYNEWISSVYRPPFKFDGLLWGPSRYYSDPDPYAWYWLNPDPSQGIANQSRVNDPNLLPLIVKQRQTLQADARKAVFDQIEKIVADQQYYVGRTTGNALTFWEPWLENFGTYLGYDWPQFEVAWDNRK